MGTTTDKLNRLINTKEGIRQEINRIYGTEEISTSDTFNSYIQKFEEAPFYERSFIDGTVRSLKLSNITTVGYNAFKNNDVIEEVYLPNVVNIIGGNSNFDTSGAFYNCYSLRTVFVPAVTTIGIKAFKGCGNLYSIELPSCQYINIKAFDSCAYLRYIYVGTNKSTVCTLVNKNAFGGTTDLNKIYVPASLVDSYKTATNWSNYASKIYAAP